MCWKFFLCKPLLNFFLYRQNFDSLTFQFHLPNNFCFVLFIFKPQSIAVSVGYEIYFFYLNFLCCNLASSTVVAFATNLLLLQPTFLHYHKYFLLSFLFLYDATFIAVSPNFCWYVPLQILLAIFFFFSAL